jgi:transcription elongation factor Elf1
MKTERTNIATCPICEKLAVRSNSVEVQGKLICWWCAIQIQLQVERANQEQETD